MANGMRYSLMTWQLPLDPPWISFILCNDDTINGAYYVINEERDILDTTVIAAEESVSEDMIHPLIHTRTKI